MEEPNSILLIEGNTSAARPSLANDAGSLLPEQKANTENGMLTETQNKLNQVFEEYSGRIESFMLMLDALNEGMVLVNRAGEICYSNEQANAFIEEIKTFETGSGILGYLELETEKHVTLSPDAQHEIHIRIHNFLWNDEPCNLFLFDKKVVQKVETGNNITHSSTLAEPFEAMMNYVQLIAQHEANGKLPEAAECAELAKKTVLQSEKLLSDVKAFISLANHQPAFTRISMQKIVGDVLKSMGPEIEEAEIEVSVSELPESIGDKELILKLIKHLVSNALKFRNKTRRSVIDIGHDKSEGQYIFCVRDNGIGISKKYHEEVFKLFTTLNDALEYPGNGLGLAICKKIVELHGGKIWVESLPGHGSNFYFKLNAKE